MMEKLRLSKTPVKANSIEPVQGLPASINPVSPKKLLLSKWTAVTPQNKEKHFLVIAVITPEPPETAVTEIDLEAAMTGRVQRLPWRELKNASEWKRGWI
jgi:tryptophan-rich hypothetical protein